MQKNKPEGKGVVHRRRFQLSVHSFHEEENTLNLFADFQSAAAAVAVSRLRGSSNPSRKITDKTVLQSVLLCAWDFDGSKDTSRALKRGPRPKRKQERKKAENTHSIKSAVLLLAATTFPMLVVPNMLWDLLFLISSSLLPPVDQQQYCQSCEDDMSKKDFKSIPT